MNFPEPGPRTRQQVRACFEWLLLTAIAGGSISGFGQLLGYSIHGWAAAVLVGLACAVFVWVEKPELRPFMRAHQAGSEETHGNLKVVAMGAPGDARALWELANEAFEGQAMDEKQIELLHGHSKHSVFLLKRRNVKHVEGYLSLFIPTPATVGSMLDGSANIDDWTPGHFFAGENPFENHFVYLESYVVLDPSPIQRKTKSRLLLVHVARALRDGMLRRNDNLPTTFLGYSAEQPGGAEPGAKLMMRRLGMKPVPGVTAHGMQLYRGEVDMAFLSHLIEIVESELFTLRAVSESA